MCKEWINQNNAFNLLTISILTPFTTHYSSLLMAFVADAFYRQYSFETLPLDKVWVMDIETVPMVHHFDELPEKFQKLWDKKTRFQRHADQSPADFFEETGGILSEFGRIICISIGAFVFKDNVWHFRLKSFYGTDERVLLTEFGNLVDKHHREKKLFYFCAHNGKEFDVPYICRRMSILQLPLPQFLQINAKKPWEIPHVLDTMELWKFGDNKNFTSLELLTALFNIPTPKDDIDGSQVRKVFYEEGDVKRIAIYCEKDVLATAQVFLALRQNPLIEDQNVSSATV